MNIEKHLITKHYTKRATTKTEIALHWSTTKTLQQIYNTFMGTRLASAHYGIGEDGEIWQFVEDKYIAWHCGHGNEYSIGIEHCGGYISEGQRVKPTQKCHDSSVELVYYLSQKHNIPIDKMHVKGHREYMATSCPGSLDVNYIISNALDMENKTTFNDFIKFNDDILVKGSVSEIISIKTKAEKIKLVKDTDNLTESQKNFLIMLLDFTNAIPNDVVNTEWLDTVMARYGAVYFQRSLDK